MDSFLTLLDSSSVLCERLSSSLSLPAAQAQASSVVAEPNKETETTPPLALLSDASQFLRGATTKFSLLAINPPFTPSALGTVLQETTGTALPSLVTAALLLGQTRTSYPAAFHDEAKVLVKDTIEKFSALISIVKNVAESEAQNGAARPANESVTVAAGRVWAACDALVSFADGGVVGFVITKANVYLELVKDGIRELEEWDPDEDDDDDFFDTGLDDDGDDDLPSGDKNQKEKQKSSEEDSDSDQDPSSEHLLKRKEHMLRILKSIAKIYPAIETYRLKPLAKKYSDPRVDLPQIYTAKMASLLTSFRSLPDHVDEATGCLYESDLDASSQNLAKAIACAKGAVDLVRESCETRGGGEDAKKEEQTSRSNNGDGDDKSMKWADTFVKVLEGLEKRE
ncbi:hypothetical protein KEM56_005691 [Ascosphaera pollenicola]|nr:hypothetical protein KEM56_005691 [Ascosphaera pollenicola]